VILFLHNRYRTTGGEERVVEDLLALVREQLGEPAELMQRDSTSLGRARAAVGLIGGGLDPGAVGHAVQTSGARVLHAHNLHPAFGWRALAAARAAGARVVLHLHQYRLVCAVGVCYTDGAECTRCHGRNTLPGLRRNCRGSSAESAAYAVSLALWQRRMVQQADAVIVPSLFARERLRELGAPLDWERVHVLAPPVAAAGGVAVGVGGQGGPDREPGGPCPVGNGGRYALVAARLSREKGVDVAIEACRIVGMPLVVAGDGPEWGTLQERVGGADVRFLGRVDAASLARWRSQATIALVPSRSAETFGLAAAEAMAAGVPVAASSVGALPELVDRSGLVPPGDAQALAAAIARLGSDEGAGARGADRVRSLCAPEVVARALAAIYA